MSKISLIIEREYLTRVQKKSFILMTILSPIVMVALIFAPIWLAQLSSDEVRQIAIIDQTGLYKNIYENSEEYQFTYTQGILNPAEMRAEESQPYAYVIIKDNLLNNPKRYDHLLSKANNEQLRVDDHVANGRVFEKREIIVI